MIAPPLASQSQGVDVTASWVGVLGVAAAIALVADRAVMLRPDRLTLAWTAFLGWAFVSTLASGRFWAGLMGEPTNMLGWFLLLATTALVLVGSIHGAAFRRHLESWVWLVVLAELLWVIYGQLTATDQSAGTFFNSTYLGEGLLLLLPWCLPARETPSGQRVARYATIALALVVFAVTSSRAAFVLLLVWIVWAVARRVHVPAAYKLAALGGLSLIALGSMIAMRRKFFDDAGSAFFGGRLALWFEDGARAVAARPLAGWGPDGFGVGKAAVGTLERAAAVVGPGTSDPHNLLVWVAVSTGVIGLTLFAWAATEVVIAWRSRAQGGIDIAQSVWAICMCLAVGMTAPLTLHVWPMLALMFGVSLWLPPVSPCSKQKQPIGGDEGLWRAVSVAAFLSIALASGAMALNAGTRASLEITRSGSTSALASKALAASRVWPLDAYIAYLTSLHTAWVSSTVPAYAAERIDLEAVERARSLDMRNPAYALEYARTVQYYRQPAEAVDAAYAEAFRRYPTFPLAHAEYAVYLAASGRTDEARGHLEIAKLPDDQDSERLEAIRQAESLIAESGK